MLRGTQFPDSNIKMAEHYASWRGSTLQEQATRRGKCGSYLNERKLFERATPKVKIEKPMYAYCTREKFLRAFSLLLRC
jgi:hypothetical protein